MPRQQKFGTVVADSFPSLAEDSLVFLHPHFSRNEGESFHSTDVYRPLECIDDGL